MGITITNSSSAATDVSTTASISTPNLIAGGFASDSVTNCVLRNASSGDVPFMPGYETNPWVMYVPSIGTGAQIDYTLYTADSSGGIIAYFPGATGMTTPDSAGMELGNNFEIEISAAKGTPTPNSFLYKKQDSFRIYWSSSDTITADFYAASGDSSYYSSTSDGHISASTSATTVYLIPNANGTYNQLYQSPSSGNHYDKVDDPVGSPDDNTTYVYYQNATGTFQDTYNLPDNQIPAGSTINSVTVYFRGFAYVDSGCWLQPVLYLNGNQTNGTQVINSPYQTWQNWNQTLSRPGGGSWTISDINNLEVGVRIQLNISNYYFRCTQLYVGVSYTPPYSYIQSLSTSTVSAGSSTFNIGQQYSGSVYTIWRGFVFFDTSPIPDYATITSAVLKLYGQADGSSTDFDILVMTGGSTYPHDPLQSGDYNISNYSGNGGSINTSSFTTSGYNSITLNFTGLGWINKTGTTKLALISSRDLSATQPSGNEYVTVYATEQTGTSNDPQLVITYKCSVSATPSGGNMY